MKESTNSIKKGNKNDRLSFKTPNLKPSKELLASLEEGEKIIQEVRKGKRQGYNNVNEMLKVILDD